MEDNIIGPTGEYPDGKLNENDKGELRIGMAVDGDVLIIDFGKSITWLGLDKSSLQSLIDILTEKLKEL